MAPVEPPLPSTFTTRDWNNQSTPLELAHGWVDQPNTRGTWDVIQTCVVTIFLCSWSSLCLNISADHNSRKTFLKNKFIWMLFTILYPEATVGTAWLQWLAARQCVEDFSAMGYTQWTMRHAFFADMGGIILQAPDFPPFPIDCQQLIYLVRKGYLDYPKEIDAQTIWDKNKADGFARAVTIVQITWFAVQCIARGAQQLTLTTLELSTIAFILCTLHTFYFWHHKPLDAEVPIVLKTPTRIADILVRAGTDAQKPYSLTPLDFVNAKPGKKDFMGLWWAMWWSGNIYVFGGILLHTHPKPPPIAAFPNTRATPPRDTASWVFVWALSTLALYFGIHIAAWNFHFPTPVERLLWRGAACVTPGLIVFYFVLFTLCAPNPKFLSKILFGHTEVETLMDFVFLYPQWFIAFVVQSVFGFYSLARLYIIVESFAGLRELPVNTFTNVEWTNFLRLF